MMDANGSVTSLPSGVAAELRLDVRCGADGRTEPLIVRLYVPVPERGDWRCDYELSGYENVRRHASGVDSWQALQLARHVVEAQLAGLWPRLLHLDELADATLLFGPSSGGPNRV